jgi:hypothetical protein
MVNAWRGSGSQREQNSLFGQHNGTRRNAVHFVRWGGLQSGIPSGVGFSPLSRKRSETRGRRTKVRGGLKPAPPKLTERFVK